MINLFEAETMTKSKMDSLMPTPTASQDIVPASKRSVAPAGHKAGSKETSKALAAASQDIATRSAGLDLSGVVASMGQDKLSDADAAGFVGRHDHEPVNPHNLPALLHQDMVAAGEDFDPQWHQVTDLPNYMLNSIRVMGREVFANLTMTEIEEIQMMCTLLNPEDDVKRMMSWIKNTGHKLDQMNFDFSHIIPGYSALVQVWQMGEFQFAFVQDMGGHYIYSWPADDGQIVDQGNASHNDLLN